VSIALGQHIAQLQREVLDLTRVLTDTLALIKQLEQRIAALETRPTGRPRKES
jgi:hypothetical protein